MRYLPQAFNRLHNGSVVPRICFAGLKGQATHTCERYRDLRRTPAARGVCADARHRRRTRDGGPRSRPLVWRLFSRMKLSDVLSPGQAILRCLAARSLCGLPQTLRHLTQTVRKIEIAASLPFNWNHHHCLRVSRHRRQATI